MQMMSWQIYVVDDDRDTADALAASLERMGHSGVAFYDGATTWESIVRSKPDCVLLDIAMDGMDGLALASAIRDRFGDDVVLIAITGAELDSKLVKSTFGMVDHYFVKPLDMSRLEAVLLRK